MKKLLCLFCIILSSTVFASDSDKIKTCLASYWQFQEKCKAVTGKFCEVDNTFKKDESCVGINVTSHKLPDSRYIAIAKMNNNIWLIDSSKTIIQVQ